ncbi:MAG: hypothetical protein GY828_03605 [Candidatus Gracilibacteria bacterium]|nr:hypothetical protein [Candidatus Gracilibacteria bacterium]
MKINYNLMPKELRLSAEERMSLGYDREIYDACCETYLDPVNHCIETSRDMILILIEMHLDK